MNTKNIATFFAILAAVLYAINIPLSKLLLDIVPSTMMAAFLYLGAGIGLFLYGKVTKERGEKLTKTELPYTIGISLQHTHEHNHIHTHEHRHGELVHSHEHEHIHSHTHIHGGNESVHGHSHEVIEDHQHSHNN